MSARLLHRHVLARLATGPIYESDSEYWLALGEHYDRIRRHYLDMGLEVVRDTTSGFAYLRQLPDDSEETWAEQGVAPLPRILRRTPLSYHQTLMLVLLREALLRHEQSTATEGALYVGADDLREMLLPYFPESNNEKKFFDAVAAIIRRFVGLNLLTALKNRSEPIYRVEPILKARLPAEQIAEIRVRLTSSGDDSEESDGVDHADESASEEVDA
jgi:hypothetical protein